MISLSHDATPKRIDRKLLAVSVVPSIPNNIEFRTAICMTPINLEGSEDENFRLPGVAGDFGDDVRTTSQVNARVQWC